MTESRYQIIKSEVISLLKDKLDPKLTYHNLAHTEDVMRQVERIAKGENISDQNELMLLKIAALFHDSGFLYVYRHHEEKSCQIMEDFMHDGDCTPSEIARIKGMIMATQIPQTPHNLMEQIICDADLDYLGRDDFERISNGLKEEFLEYKVIKNEFDWDPLQIGFFEAHNYFTETCRVDRTPKKLEHLEKLKMNHRLT
jgi:predicted metal-dependent HD superfamily phosphohydrolase